MVTERVIYVVEQKLYFIMFSLILPFIFVSSYVGYL